VSYKGGTGIAVLVRECGETTVKVFSGEVSFPYIPGYLFVREAPLIIETLKGVECDLIVVDAHGLAHPRKSGLATVIGVLMGLPSIGVAKSMLVGELVEEGGTTYISVRGQRVGVKLGRYFYSIGNLVDLQDVVDFARQGYPNCLKEADRLSKLLYKSEPRKSE